MVAHEISRENFDSFWLESCRPNENYTKFKHLPMKEKKDSRNYIKESLTKAIIDHHIHHKKIKYGLKNLGYEKAAQYFSSMLPKDEKTRKGNFGEVIASEHLRQRYHFNMPIFKLRYADNPMISMRGEDIIAFKISKNNKITAICIGEAKTLKKFRQNKIKDAHDRLVIAYRPNPISLSLISTILYEKNQNELANEIESILQDICKKTVYKYNWIFLITGNNPLDPFSYLQNLDKILDNLNVVNLYLPELTTFVNDIFENIEQGISNDYE